VDSLLANGKRETALSIIERLLRDQPQNWEFLYREGAALGVEKPDEASRRFRQLLALHLSDDEQGAQLKARLKQTGNRAAAATVPIIGPSGGYIGMAPVLQRTQIAYEIRRVTGLEARDIYYSGMQQIPFWGPGDFGQARMAALGWLLRIAEKQDHKDEFLRE